LAEKVIYLKLLTGEDLIASVEIFEDEVLIKKPLHLVYQGDHIKYMSWIPLYDDKTDNFSIRKDHVVLSKTPPAHILKHYNSIWDKEEHSEPGPYAHAHASNTNSHTVH